MDTSCGQSKVEAQAQVSHELELLEKDINNLSPTIGRATERLNLVLSNEPPASETEKDEDALVPLAELLRSLRRQTRSAVEQIEAMIDRIEL